MIKHTELFSTYCGLKKSENAGNEIDPKKKLPYLYAYAEQKIGFDRFCELMDEATFYGSSETIPELKQRLSRDGNLTALDHVNYLSILHSVRKLYKKEYIEKNYPFLLNAKSPAKSLAAMRRWKSWAHGLRV